MDFGFPHFTRASTDDVCTQPPLKSLLELVIEAKGRLGLVPQREAPKRHPSSSLFSNFSDSDEEHEGRNGDGGEAEPLQDAVLTTRTAWVPPSYLLDYFFSGEFLSVFLSLHGIHSSRPVSRLVPPLLAVRDAQLHPVVEAGFCDVLKDMSYGSSYPKRGGGRGRGAARGRGDGRGASFTANVFRGDRQRGYMGRNAAAAHIDSSSVSPWGAAQLDRLQGGVLSRDEGNDDGAAGPYSLRAGKSPDGNALSTMDEAAGIPPARRLLFRGLQQVALPALLLGDHVLLSGPRGIGKRTAALLSAGANVLAYTDNADPDNAGGTATPPLPADVEGEAAAEKASPAAGEAVSTSPTKEEVKPEAAAEDAVDAAETHPATAEPRTGRASTPPPAPRALIVVSSYPEVFSVAHWLEAVFGPVAFSVYTFQKDGAVLCPVLEVPTTMKQQTPPGGSDSAHLGDVGSSAGVMPVFPPITSDGRFIGPPLLLPFISDTVGAGRVSGPPLGDPTQADHVPLPTESTLPALAELAALVMDASLPADVSDAGQGSAKGCARSVSAARKRRRAAEEQGQDDRDVSVRSDERHSSRTHRRRHRDQSPHGARDGGEEGGREGRGDRDSGDRRRHHRHRHRSDRADGGDSSKHARALEDRGSHSRRHSVRESSSSRGHRSSGGSRRHRHRSRSEERRSRHGNSRHRHRHHRSRRSRYDEAPRTASSSSSTSSSTVASITSLSCRHAGPPSLIPPNTEVVLSPVLHSDLAPPTADELRALALDSMVPVAPSSSVDAEEQQETAKTDTDAQPSDILHQRVPLLITTYHALQTALGLVQGEASALPPLEHVRVALFTNLERVLMPPLKESFLHSWWLSLVNALDVECQFIVTADRMGSEVRGFLDSTVIPDAGERLVQFDQGDASIWAIMDVQVCAVPVDVPLVASSSNDGSGGRPRISASDIDAAKVTYLFSTITSHFSPKSVDASLDGEATCRAPYRGRQGGRVVIICSARREQSQVLTQLQRLFSEQEHGSLPSMVRVTDAAEVFRASEAEVLVVTDSQLADPRVLRDVHQCAEVDLILHFSLPRSVMAQLEKDEIIAALAHRGRAILGNSRQFASRRWWRGDTVAPAPGGRGAAAVAASDSMDHTVDFVPAKVECQLLLTEHNMHGRAGSSVAEALREVNDA